MRALAVSLLLIASATANGSESVETLETGTFDLISEPSGVIALDESTLIVVEDESSRALRRLQRMPDSPNFAFKEFEQAAGTSFIQRRLLAPLEDLEGIARISSTRFFVVGSHEDANRGKRPAREKLVLFTRDGSELVSAMMRQDLYDHIDRQYPDLSEKFNSKKNRSVYSLNIEGLAFDRKRKELLIGLRTPTLDDDAIIIKMLNASQYMEGDDPLFAEELQLIDLDKGSIRAMAYDDRSDTLLIASQRESGKKDRASLWIWPAAGTSDPIRIRSEDKQLFDNVEGLTPINERIFFVRDTGGKKSKHDELWFTVPRSQLGLKDKH